MLSENSIISSENGIPHYYYLISHRSSIASIDIRMKICTQKYVFRFTIQIDAGRII